MTTSVRFYDSGVVNTSNNYNDGSTSDGTAGKGRFVLTVDAFTAPTGTDGQFEEFDFVVDDPGDPTMVFWGWVGVNVAASPATVDVGFTFDTDTPSGFDYWGCFRTSKSAYDSYLASNLVAGATNYARNNATFYDGTYHIQGLGFVVPVSGASISHWWDDAPLPASTAPTITAPADGASYSLTDDLVLTVTWTEPGSEVDSQVRTSGALTSDSGSIGGTFSHDITIPYGTSGTIAIDVRAQQSGLAWSAYSTVHITVSTVSDPPLSCISADLNADTPSLAWLFRDSSLYGIADSSGNGNDGRWEYPFQFPDPGATGGTLVGGSGQYFGGPTVGGLAGGGFSAGTVTAQTYHTTYGGSAGDLMFIVLAVPAAVTVTPPAGWSTQLNLVQGSLRAYIATKVNSGSEPATYTFTCSGPVDENVIAEGSITGWASFSIVTAAATGTDTPFPTFTPSRNNALPLAVSFAETTSELPGAPNHWSPVGWGSPPAGATLPQSLDMGVLSSASSTAHGAVAYTPGAHAGTASCDRIGAILLVEPAADWGGYDQVITVGSAADIRQFVLVRGSNAAGYTSSPGPAIFPGPPATPPTPAGWTLVDSASKDDVVWLVYTRDAVAGDPTTVTLHWPDPLWSVAHVRTSVPKQTADFTYDYSFVADLVAVVTTPDQSDSVKQTEIVSVRISAHSAETFGTLGAGTAAVIDQGWFQPSASTALAPSGATGAQAIFTIARRLITDVPLLQQTPAPICDPSCTDPAYFVDGAPGPLDILTGQLVSPIVSAGPAGLTVELLTRPGASGTTPWGTIQIFPSGIYVSINGLSASWARTLDPRCWYHAVATYDGSELTLFVNGARVAVTTGGSALPADSTDGYYVAGGEGAAYTLFAVYESALDRVRIANHFAHLCRLCAGGFTLGGPGLAFN